MHDIAHELGIYFNFELTDYEYIYIYIYIYILNAGI